MKSRLIFIAGLFLAAVLITSSSISAMWMENGIGLKVGDNDQNNPAVLADGAGGVFMVWEEFLIGSHDIYAQRLDAFGNKLWGETGIPVCADAFEQFGPVFVHDGAGGVIIAWEDNRNYLTSGYDIYAQRLDGDGNPIWMIDGVPVCTADEYQMFPQMITDEEGGAILAWDDARNGLSDIYAQRLDGTGALLWTPGGIPVCTAVNLQTPGDMVSDGLGGAMIVWSDYRSGAFSDIYAQRILPSGAFYFAADGMPVCAEPLNQASPQIVSDISIGFIITWQDYRNSDWDIYAQKINIFGTTLWTSGGIVVCDDGGSQIGPRIITDGAWGAIIAWKDQRTSPLEILAQKINGSGNNSWTSGGIFVSGLTGSDKINHEMVSDGNGGAIVAWLDERSVMEYNLYIDLVDAQGVTLWEPYGTPVRLERMNAEEISIASDGSGGAIMAWQDRRSVTNSNIYAQRVERNGYWGYPSAVLSHVRDIPLDQGGWVNLAWNASRIDPWPAGEITSYTAWRAISESAALSMQSSGAIFLQEVPATLPELDSPAIMINETATGQYYWELVATVAAFELENYAVTVPTLFDSTDVTNEFTFFQVVAHTDDPDVYWISPVDSGYSVDNLAPAAPLGLTGEQVYTPEGLLLTWDPNGESDLAGYKIYRGTNGSFVPGPGNFIGSTPDTFSVDGDWSWETGYWYKVAAVDIHGNESLFAIFGPDMVTGDDPMPVPDATFLAQNFPNPFNPNTTITFGLKQQGHVCLRIYDAAGRLVASLLEESRPAGNYTAEWNGRGESGNPLSSGVYFYRLTAGDFEETRKMILLR
jgi:hypothetical protein